MKMFPATILSLALFCGAGPAFAAGCDVELGAKSFRACKACHELRDGENGIGPHLFGVVERAVASVAGYQYSEGMKTYAEDAGVWDAARLNRFLSKPSDEVKGTKMSYGGLKTDGARDALICYLKTVR